MIKVGTIVGDRYEILEQIGSGGMAEVFKGRDHKLNRLVAVKVLKEEFREIDGFVKKFKEEARAAAGLAHPNIVNVYDVGDENGIYYIVMELVEGITLKNYIERKGRLTIKEATSIAIQVSAGLEAAHDNQIVHRDIKPQNIIISREGKVKVTDFGIAKATTSQTTTSNAMGSVHYASPEQARGGYVDHRSDIYSLGIVLYEMVTGRVPFDGETAVTVAVKHLQEEMVPPSTYCRELPHSLEQIIYKCTQKSPDRRYQDMEDLLADLKQSLMDPDGDFVKMVDVDANARTRTAVVDRESAGKLKASRKVEVPDEQKKAEIKEEEDEEDEYDDDDDEELSPAVERIMTIAGVALAILIVIILLLLVSRMLGLGKGTSSSKNDTQQTEELEESDEKEDEEGTSSSVNTVVMPNLLGDTMTEAKVELQNLGVNITLKGSEVSSEYPAGQIIEQSVESGTRVEVGSNVDVVIAAAGSTSGSSENSSTENTTQSETETTVEKDTKVPNVVGQTEANARTALEAANLKVGTVSEANSDTVPSGSVISQSLSQNTTVEKNTTVNLVISSGPKNAKVTDVIGHESTRATSELEADGFNVAVKEVYTDEMRAGLVVSTSPERGSYVAPGTTVTITVSKGEEQVTIPSVGVGMSFETAEENLRSAGFKGEVQEAFENSNSVGKDYVTRYSPSSTVSPNGTVTIYVSLGAAE
jgi:serine/threonine-protein kinase